MNTGLQYFWPAHVPLLRRVEALRLILAATLLTGLLLSSHDLRAQQPTQSPHGELDVSCTLCHGPDDWSQLHIDSTFNHAKYGYRLDGAHGTTACVACHRDLQFPGTPTSCHDCHQDVHRGELGPACDRCHSLRGFTDRALMLRSHQSTRFPLTASHLGVDCESCHPARGQGGMQFVGTPTQCTDCHQEALQTAQGLALEVDHNSPGFEAGCELCHRTTIWQQGRFNHASFGFGLTGAHGAQLCADCHRTSGYVGLSNSCISCHGPGGINDQYSTTTSPPHPVAGFTAECSACHSSAAGGFQTSRWRHPSSPFGLTGAHAAIAQDCARCHVSGYGNTRSSCEACHGPGALDDQWTGAAPNHATLGWPQTCLTCHAGSGNTADWSRGVTLPRQYHTMFSPNHEGAHGDCSQCHNSTNYSQSTCSNHHHPPSCTFTNQGPCHD